MIRRFFRLLLLCIVTVVLIIFFAPSLIKGAGDALITSIDNSAAQGIAQVIPHDQGNGADLHVKLDGLTANTRFSTRGNLRANSTYARIELSPANHSTRTNCAALEICPRLGGCTTFPSTLTPPTKRAGCVTKRTVTPSPVGRASTAMSS